MLVEPPMTGVLLAKKWDGVQDMTGWWLSEKLDGVRAYWNGKHFSSRNGNTFHAPPWFKKGLPNCALDGELWCGRRQFQKCVGIVRSSKRLDEWKFVTYLVFDAPEHPGKFEERMKFVNKVIRPDMTPTAAAVGMVKCKGNKHIFKELAKVEKSGGEGLMLRQPGSLYKRCRDSSLLKVKSFFDEEAIVIGHKKGTGRNSHRMGHLQVKTPDGRVFDVGSGFTDAQRDKPPKLGTIITYRYQELSNSGKPRFPTFQGVRIDIDWKDYCKTYKPPNKNEPGILKRKHTILYSSLPDEDNMFGKADGKPGQNESKASCKYGANCYRKDVAHLKKYLHITDDSSTAKRVGSPKLKKAMKRRKVTPGQDAASCTSDVPDKPLCQYGASCYRSNLEHLEKYYHPPKFGKALSGYTLREPDDPLCPKCAQVVLVERGTDRKKALKKHFENGCVVKSVFVYLVEMDSQGTSTPLRIALPEGTTLIGRGQVGLTDPRLSRKQLEIAVKGRDVKLRSLGLNPCLVSKKGKQYCQLVKKQWCSLLSGDCIAFLPDLSLKFSLTIAED